MWQPVNLRSDRWNCKPNVLEASDTAILVPASELLRRSWRVHCSFTSDRSLHRACWRRRRLRQPSWTLGDGRAGQSSAVAAAHEASSEAQQSLAVTGRGGTPSVEDVDWNDDGNKLALNPTAWPTAPRIVLYSERRDYRRQEVVQ